MLRFVGDCTLPKSTRGFPRKVRCAISGSKMCTLRHLRLLFHSAVTLFLGFAACDGQGLPPDYRRLPVPEARLISTEARNRGRGLFLEHCAICHGEHADGKGRRRNLSLRAADFTDPAWRQRMTPRRAYYVVREGVRGTPMPAWKILDSEQTWDVVAYVLSVSDAGP